MYVGFHRFLMMSISTPTKNSTKLSQNNTTASLSFGLSLKSGSLLSNCCRSYFNYLRQSSPVLVFSAILQIPFVFYHFSFLSLFFLALRSSTADYHKSGDNACYEM
uniref:Secreted protein n=1 Tax=Ascaris lumbricoides TaxID=6252 RepID=A0A0M3I102_ASCLU